MGPLGQSALLALGLAAFYFLVWRSVGFRPERVVARGTRLYDQGDFAGALELYRKARRRAPKSALAWECEGLACFMLDRFDEAHEALSQAVRLKPTPRRSAHAYRALALARDGDLAGGRAALDDLVTGLGEVQARADLAILADAARAVGGDEAVCETISRLVARVRGLPMATLLLAEAEWRRGRPAAALAQAVLAGKADPLRAAAVEALARAELGDPEGARSAAQRAGSLLLPALRARLAKDIAASRAARPEGLEDVLQHALTVLEAGDGPGAARVLADARELEASPAVVRTLTAFHCLAVGEWSATVAPTTAREMLALARAAMRGGLSGRAREVLAAANAIDPGIADAVL